MNLRVELPHEVVDEIVEQVTERVLATIVPHHDRPSPPSPYMTVEEAAEYLCCGYEEDEDGNKRIKRQRVDDLLSSKRLSRFKDGSRTLVSRAEIEDHLEDRGETTVTCARPVGSHHETTTPKEEP